MLKSERKKLTLERIDAVLKPRGYRARIADGIRYYLPQDGVTVAWTIVFLNLGWINSRGVMVTHDEVELILQRVKDENYPFPWQMHRGTILTPTIRHRTFVDEYDTADMDTEEQIEDYCNWYLGYINGEGADFVQHYSYLPNVLKRMDELLNQGLSWQNGEQGILAGTLDAFFRGLIIAKLCNDPESNFESKVRFCEKYLYDGTNNKWLPYYEKLKAEVLPTIEPKYNL